MSQEKGSWVGRLLGRASDSSIEESVLTARNNALGRMQELADIANTHDDIQVRRDAVDKIHDIQANEFRGTDMTQRFYDRMERPHLKQEIQDAAEGKYPPEGAPTRDWVTGRRGVQGSYKRGKK